ncbi:MAG: hypothetical protein GDA56_20760 [Hormoscilla sp. GM7CHS1pb]|nr:hypothetical protein [Hormoscilla sp. GM7CHS1pb]
MCIKYITKLSPQEKGKLFAQLIQTKKSKSSYVSLSFKLLFTDVMRSPNNMYECDRQNNVEAKLLNMLVGSDFHTRVAPAAF